MTSRRSYLDTLNTGRQRRGSGSLDDLARTLEALEAHLERPSPFAEPRKQSNASAEEKAENLSADVPTDRLQTVARDLDRTRRAGDEVAVVGQIAQELQALRDEMRQQMSESLTREFEDLRGDVKRIAAEAEQGTGSETLLGEIDRLSGAIADLSRRSDDEKVGLLRAELEEVKASIGSLAREDTLREVGDAFDRRMEKFEEQVAAARPVGDTSAFEALVIRLEQIASAVDVLPESLSVSALDERVRTLAGALDHFARKQDAQSEQTIEMIGERLDEISRAIAASLGRGQPAVVDLEPFQRIEARMSSLAQQIEELTEDRPSAQVMGQLSSLSSRVDELAARAALPEEAVERLSTQLAQIVQRLEKEPASADVEAIFEGLERRFAILSDALDRRQTDSIEQGNLLLEDLEARLDAIVARLDLHAEQRPDQGEILSMMDERFAFFAARLDERVASGPEAESIRELEKRLGEIATRLDESVRQSSAIDVGIIGRLEAQVAEMSVRLSQPAHAIPDLEDLAPRFDQIERSIASQHQSLIGAARSAAAEAVSEWAERAPDPQAIVSLSAELRSLEALTRKSDERNSKTFEAIHDTLIKIVDRLSAMEIPDVEDDRHEEERHEEEPTAADEPVPSKPLVADAPSIAADDVTLLADDLDEQDTVADDLPIAPTEPSPPIEAPLAKASEDKDKRSMLGGLTKALRGRKDKRAEPEMPAPTATLRDEPSFPSLDQPLDPKIANQPLEPGSGAPDLNAIMKRVRDERGPISRKDDIDAAKSDFIAAARRAAQAAAAEAVIKKRGGEGPEGNRGKLGKMLGLRRKTVLMATAAAIVGMGGLQLGRAYVSNDLPRLAMLDDFFTAEVPQVTEATEEPPLPPVLMAAEAGPAAPAAPAAPLPTVIAMEAGENKNVALDAPQAVQASVLDAPQATQVSAPETVPAVSSSLQTPQALPVLPAAADEPATALAQPEQPEQPEQPVEPVIVAAATPTPAALDLEAQEAAAVKLPPIAIPTSAGPVALREAAETGDAKALYEIATRFAEGRNGAVDMKAAAEWYLRAAEIGYAPAQYRAGNFYEKGLGVDRDVAKAKAFYEASAAQGNANAMHNLAVLHAMGADGTTNNPEAVRWFTQAADLGVKDSQFNLGILAAKGVGMQQDLPASFKWFSLLAADGDKDAAAKRDEVAGILKPEELERARADVAAWNPKPQDPAVSEVDIPNEWRESQDTTASVDMKQAVTNIQLILNKNGYDAGAPDGMLGGKTKKAIIAFQSANGLTADGEINEPLVRALLAKK